MPVIHPTAIIGKNVQLDDSVEIGPYTVIEDNVSIGADTKILGQCRICSYTEIGSGNKIYPFAAIGGDPHDYSFDITKGASFTKIGNNNLIHEYVTIQRGAHPGTTTEVGNDNFFMAMAHVAHNCQIGNHVIIACGSLCAGYVQVQDNALVSGNCCVHQFCRVGRFAVLSGGSSISVDLPPFMIGDGRNGGVRSFNKVGLSRAGWTKEEIRVVRNIYDIFFRQGLNMSNARKKVEETIPRCPITDEFFAFLEQAKRGILSGRDSGRRS